jgi:hypothetical protein
MRIMTSLLVADSRLTNDSTGAAGVEAVLEGSIIEEYPDDQRALICGKTSLSQNVIIYLHVVCEYADPIYAEFVTAYIPDELEWESPLYVRRKGKKK